MTISPFIIAAGVFFFGTIIGFVGGMLFFRRHGERIEADADKVSAVVKNIKETTKSL